MYVIGPMVLYLCERVLRLIRYLQTVRYRMVCLHSPFSSAPFATCLHRGDVRLVAPPADRDAAVQSAGAAAGEERLQDGGGPVRLPQLPGHLPAGVAPLHHDLGPRGGFLQRPHPLGRRLDRQTHRHHAEAARGSAGAQVRTRWHFEANPKVFQICHTDASITRLLQNATLF